MKFECQKSGKCCMARGEYGYVYLTIKDRERLAKFLNVSMKEFQETYCEKSMGRWHLKDPGKDCMFLKDFRCSVYEGRPTQCRTWPFWPSNMSARKWSTNVASFCPGVGKGQELDEAHIAAQVHEQTVSDGVEAFENQFFQ